MISLQGSIKLKDGSIFDLNYRNLKEINLPFFTVSKLDLPSYGIISNKGNITFNDTNRQIIEKASSNIIGSNLQVNLELKNLVYDLTESKGTWYTDTWSIDSSQNVIDLSIKDDLLEWQNIELSEMFLQSPMTMFELYEKLKIYIPTKFEFEMDEKTENYLKAITCEYPLLHKGSAWSQFDKLAKVCALNIFKTDKNKVKVTSNI